MNNFEERLLGELRTAVADREPAPEIPRRVPRRRVALAVAACATLAAGGSVVVPMLGGETAAEAFAVSQGPDGQVTVKIYRGEVDDEALERRIESYGIEAEVDFLPVGQRCQFRPGTGGPIPKHSSTDYWGDPSVPPGTQGITFDPAQMRGVTLVIEGSGWFGGTVEPGKAAAVSFGFRTGPVPACEPRPFPTVLPTR